jgi:hypothetical protein
MSRKKIIEPEIVEPEGTEEGKPKTTRKAITRTTVEKFVADEPAEFEQDDAEVVDEPEVDEPEDEEPEEIQLDPLAKFAQSIGASTGYYLYVTRLPDPQQARGLYRTPCIEETQYGWIPFDADNFVADVQNLTGSGGRYRLQVRQSSGAVVRQVTTNLADPFLTGNPQREQSSTAQAGAQPPQTFRSFTEQAKEFAETARALGLVPRSQQPQQTAHTEALPAAPPPSAAEQLKDVAAMVETITSVSARINPPRESSGEQGTIAQIGEVLDVVGRHAPTIVPLVLNWFGGRRQQQATQPPQQNGAPQQLPEQPVNPLFQMLEPLRPAIDLVCAELVNDNPVDESVKMFEQIQEQHPEFVPMIDLLAKRSSVETLNMLAEFTGNKVLLSLRHGAAWIEGLQEALRPQGEEEEGGDDQDDAVSDSTDYLGADAFQTPE